LQNPQAQCCKLHEVLHAAESLMAEQTGSLCCITETAI